MNFKGGPPVAFSIIFVIMQHFLPNGKKLVIRVPEVRDAQACLDCFLQLTQETDFLLFTHEEAKQIDLAAEEAFIRSYLHHPDNLYLIAEADDEVVGTLSLDQARFNKQKHMARLGVAVLHKYWNMGIGRRLLTAAIRWAEAHPHITTIHFEALATNERAIQLYRNFNFIEHGRIPQGLRQTNGEWVDLVVMSKRIKP